MGGGTAGPERLRVESVMQVAAIRQQFLDYFAARGHTIVPSAPLVPGNDPTLLFTNSGMVQFKDVFLGTDKRPTSAPPTSQRCVRAGGKHNDLENVGYTARHHTFFEMLGNFVRRLLQARRDRLRLGAADRGLPPAGGEALDHRLPNRRRGLRHRTGDIGVPRERIVRIGDNKGAHYASDNFWQMGDTGPCGPCSEIFYDHGPAVAGGPPGSAERGRPLHRDLEPGVHAVQPRRGTACSPPAEALRGHRHGARAPRRGAAGRAQQLRHRPVPRPDRRGGEADRRDRPRRAFAQGDRRPHPRLRLPGRRRRDPEQRGPRLCPAADHPARDPPRLQARADPALLRRAGTGARATDGRGLPGAAAQAGRGHSGAACRGGALRRNARARHEDPRRRARRSEGHGQPHALRRDRLHALRHLRLPPRPDGRHLPRARR